MCSEYLDEPKLITGIVYVIYTTVPTLSEDRVHCVIICAAESKWIFYNDISMISFAHEKVECTLDIPYDRIGHIIWR